MATFRANRCRVILLFWAGFSVCAPALASSTSPNEGELSKTIQLWFRAEDVTVENGKPVVTWPDHSGVKRDLIATEKLLTGGIGRPATFVKSSTLSQHPAVRFDDSSGYATAPANPVAISGDSAMTMTVVVNLQPSDSKLPFDIIFGIGEPANPLADPGKPLAAMVAIDRGDDHGLSFAGGWYHDCSAGPASFRPLYGQPAIITITKTPGPMRTTTRFFINGELAARGIEPTRSRPDSVPDVRHRSDIGAYMGRAMSWAGAIRGDVGEVLLYNKALSDPERKGVELYLSEKFSVPIKKQETAPRAKFTAAEAGYWAFQPVKSIAPPDAKDPAWASNPIDRFVLARMSAAGLSPAAPADKGTLIRRVTFDLTGLPPTPQEVESFLHDASPQAYEHLVDRLLASPQYGEHWARHWLDVVRYADTTANDANAVMRYAWRYRNYVIDAFNRDLPYDQFLIEQLAGDLLPPGVPPDPAEQLRRTIATGYLMIGPKALAETDKEQSRLDIVDDQIDVTGRAMLGMTLACARCHDHKFDAIRTTDYYAIAGIFRSTEPFQNEDRNASMWWEFPMPGPGGQPVTVMAPREATPRDLRVHVRGSRFALGATVPRGFMQVIDPQVPQIAPVASGRLELAKWIANRSNPLTARVMVNRIWQNHFGRGLVDTSDNFGVRGERPSHPELLDWLASRFVGDGWSIKAMHRLMVLSSTYRQGSRASDAASQADPDNRLLSHMSRRRLSAEELRDSVLQISGKLDGSMDTGESAAALLERSEKADEKALVRPNRMGAGDPFYSSCVRRSVYLPIVRNSLPDVLALFDAADPNGVTAVRSDTTVPSQSLFLMNSAFIREQSLAFANRLLSETSLSDEDRIRAAHQWTIGRQPTTGELQDARDFVAAYIASPAVSSRPETQRRATAWQSYCQTLFCQNEFLYRD